MAPDAPDPLSRFARAASLWAPYNRAAKSVPASPFRRRELNGKQEPRSPDRGNLSCPRNGKRQKPHQHATVEFPWEGDAVQAPARRPADRVSLAHQGEAERCFLWLAGTLAKKGE